MTPVSHSRELISRLARLDSADCWQGDLNPTQRAALNYLARANRFSRSPSHIAMYLGTTRGTTSQSLKSLLQKGYVQERRFARDKRVISYDLTTNGQTASQHDTVLDDALATLAQDQLAVLQEALSQVLRTALARNNNQEFGFCRDCAHHRPAKEGAFCALLQVNLIPSEADQICAEQVSA